MEIISIGWDKAGGGVVAVTINTFFLIIVMPKTLLNLAYQKENKYD